ncbi:hypothetical protein FGG08_003986 [Glutinoglossum americanum]|uniref:Alpha-galactosidase n=1 Tax=Glutinoglossum americanum TaxID=1670608 RepID=A0A9P8I363_9PEZI|nr:hypothetical protein FGG08_003986 [Glutinoglossum americanum]
MANLVFTPTLHPPIGHTTTRHARGGVVEFQCLMELSCGGGVVPPLDLLQPDQHFTVLLWWSIEGRGAWKPAAFRRSDEASDRTTLQHYYKDEANTKRYEIFTLHLPYSNTRPLQFCLKYRFGDGPWLWSGSRIGGVDGRIIFLPPQSFASSGPVPDDGRSRLPLQFGDIFEPHSERDTGALFDVMAMDEGSSQEELDLLSLLDIGVWCVTSPLSRIFNGSGNVSKSKDGRKQVVDLPLGRATLLERWMALVKIASPWMGPIHSGSAAGGGGGGSTFTTTKECLLLLMQRRDGRQVAILPLSGIPSGGGTPTASSYVTSFHASECMDRENGREGIIWRIYDESPPGERLGSAKCIVVAGMDAKNVVKGAMSWAEFIVKKTSHPGAAPIARQLVASEHRRGELPSGTFLPESHIAQGPPTEHRLNKMHAGLSYCTWNSLGVNLSGEKILDALQGLHESGIKVCNVIIDDNWQTLVGYSFPSGSFAGEGPADGYPHGIQENAKYASSGTWSAFRANSNFDSVGGLPGLAKRIRNQHPNIQNVGVWHALHGYWDGIAPGGEIDSNYKTIDCAWRDNVHQQERNLRFIDPTDIERFYDDFYRTSDDFYPNVPESHGWHIFANAMNMIIFSHLNIVPDWDMFQTALPRYAGFHAAARCLSGGPVVITDTPGDHDVGLIQQMTAITPDGHRVTLRPTSMATPSDPYMSYTSSKLLRITNIYLRGSNYIGSEVASFLGFFNISTVHVRDLLPLSDFDGLREGSHYITRSYRSGRITPPTAHIKANNAFLTLHLEPGEWDILTAVPVIGLFDSSDDATCYVGSFGLSTNMTGAAAVTNSSVTDILDDNGKGCGVSIQYSLSALGTLLIYVSSAIGDSHKRLRVEICGLPLSVDEGYWRIRPGDENLVEIFVDKAYEELRSHIRDSVHVTYLTVNVILYGVEMAPNRIGAT